MVKFGIAFGIFLLRSVIISAAEECDDSANLQRQRQQSQPMTPLAPSYIPSWRWEQRARLKQIPKCSPVVLVTMVMTCITLADPTNRARVLR